MIQKSILLAIGNAGERQSLLARLASPELRVDIAAAAQDAASLVRQTRYDVIVIDNESLDDEVMNLMTAHERNSAPVVLLVASSSEVIDHPWVHGVVSTPYDGEELAQLVQSCAELRGKRSLTMCLATAIAGTGLIDLLVG